MNENKRNDILYRLDRGESQRTIARSLQVSRNSVKSVLEERERARMGRPAAVAVAHKIGERRSVLDAYRATIEDLLARRPNMSIVELHRHLCDAGFPGGYTIVRTYVLGLRNELRRGTRASPPSPGARARVEYRNVDLDFVGAGRRRASLFICTLSFSGRRVVRFTPRQDLISTLYAHALAFERLGGVAPLIEYDNMPCVFDSPSGTEPQFNATFLRFASHYAFRPRAVATGPSSADDPSSADGDAFFAQFTREIAEGGEYRTLDHANDAAAHWLNERGDAIPFCGAPPAEARARELAWLNPLPAAAWTG